MRDPGRGRDEARDRAVAAVGRAVADGRGRDEARDRAVPAERGRPAGNGKAGGKQTETLEHYSKPCLTGAGESARAFLRVIARCHMCCRIFF